MTFYGYDPARFVQRDKFGIGAASQVVGQTVAQVPRLQREKIQFEQQQAQIKEAAEAAKKDWKSMDIAWRTTKNEYARYAQPLLDSGQMTLEEFKSNMTKLTKLKPMENQKKDPEGYIKTLGTTYGLLIDDAKKRIRTQEIVPEISTAIGGRQLPEREITETTGYQPTVPAPTTEGAAKGVSEAAPAGQFVAGRGQAAPGFRTYQPEFQKTALPAMQEPAARTREEAYGRLPSEKAITTGEFEEYGGKYLPTGMDIKKQQADEEYKKKMLAKGYGKDAVDSALKELDFLRKSRNDASRKELSLEDDKRMLTSLKNQVQKGEALSPEDITMLTERGIDPGLVSTGGNELAVEITDLIKETGDKIAIQSKDSKAIENAYRLKLENPTANIHEVLRKGISGGEIIYPEAEPEKVFEPPPVLGGRKQVGARGKVGGTQTPAQTITKKRGTGF